ncbi:MAG: nucleotide exchange factor GrpE, partial [Oscillospiraceae bacterium]|nr:nucleotide exchange factor GrpE [Oscillospiraceae bacterium]
EILPVFDNFERALNAETTDESYKQGVSMIFKQMGDMLTKLGVEVIDPTGKEFDPNVANAVNQIEDPELGENIVAETFQKGYKIGDKIIRYAMVVVANP